MKFATLGLMALVLSGCVPLWTGSAMQEDIAALKAEQSKLNADLGTKQAELSEMVESARAEVAKLNEMTREATELLARNNADFGLELERIRQEFQRMSGQFEETDFRMQKLQTDLRLFKEDVDIRFADGGGAPLPDKADELFKFGADKLKARDFRTARRAFESFATKFARDARMPDVVYMMGESYFEESQWVSAVFEYQKVWKSYTRSDRAGDAVYRIGESYVYMGKCKEAAIFFEAVNSDYPKSKFAADARTKLAKMKDGSCP